MTLSFWPNYVGKVSVVSRVQKDSEMFSISKRTSFNRLSSPFTSTWRWWTSAPKWSIWLLMNEMTLTICTSINCIKEKLSILLYHHCICLQPQIWQEQLLRSRQLLCQLASSITLNLIQPQSEQQILSDSLIFIFTTFLASWKCTMMCSRKGFNTRSLSPTLISSIRPTALLLFLFIQPQDWSLAKHYTPSLSKKKNQSFPHHCQGITTLDQGWFPIPGATDAHYASTFCKREAINSGYTKISGV